MRETKDLTRGPIARQIVSLALPILGSSFVQMTYSFVDMAWLGRLGSEEVAATGAASVFVWLANSISLFNKVGAETTVAYEVGRRSPEAARSYASHTTTLALLMGAAVFVLYFLFAPALLGFYRMAPEISALGVTYLRIAAFGIPVIFFGTALTGIYNATGHSAIPFRMTAIAVALNVLLDPLFIFGLDMGVAGAAWATLLSQLLGVGLLLLRIKKDRLLGGFRFLSLRLEGAKTRLLFRIGGAVALMNALFSLINLSLGRFASLAGGHIGVTAMSIGGQLEGLSFHTAEGFSTALSSFVAQNYGAGNHDRIKSGLRFALSLSLVVGSVVTLLFYLFGTEIFALIVPDTEAAAEGGRYLRINAFAEIFMMLEITFQGYFYGLQRSVPPSVISIAGNLLRIPASWLFLLWFPGLSTLWIVITVSSVLKGLAALAYYLASRPKGTSSLT